jgi:hypothetical protein
LTPEAVKRHLHDPLHLEALAGAALSLSILMAIA